MLWRPSHTDTAKAAILGLIDVIKFGNPKESGRWSRHCSGPAVWEKAERMETIEGEGMGEDHKDTQGPAGWWVASGGRHEERERESIGMAVRCASRCVGFWVYRVVTDCHRFDRLRFAR